MAAHILNRALTSASSILLAFAFATTTAQVLIPPGSVALRHELEQLNDARITNIPLTQWPIPSVDIESALESIDESALDHTNLAVVARTQGLISRNASSGGAESSYRFALGYEPRIIRTFEDTPREESAVSWTVAWRGDRAALNLTGTLIARPFDGDNFRPDGTYVSFLLGNWLLTAGWQDRWLGPGRDSSLILGTNARPTPGIGLQRAVSRPFKTPWLSWMGPWTLAVFMTELDDTRIVDGARLFGLRGSIRPLSGLEIGLSRTAQWCGAGRPCDLSTFGDLLVGNDNRGVNISAADEPGDQLGGIDIRWALPRKIPVVVYMQWIGEDGRDGFGAIGSWMRQVGVETWGAANDSTYRVHLEISDTTCHEGGFGFGDSKPNCAYEHSIYQTGYRYKGRSIGHGTDGDSLSYSIGSTLVQSGGHTWNATLRYMDINRQGAPGLNHTLSPGPQERYDLLITHERLTPIGGIYGGLGYRRIGESATAGRQSDILAFVQWTSR